MTDFVNDVFIEREKKSKEFYLANKPRINEIKAKINRNIFHLLKLTTENQIGDNIEHSFDGLQLIDRATKLNITCIELIEDIKFVEAGIISRSVIELCTTAIAVCKVKNQFEKFIKNKKFDSPKTVSLAKKYIPEIGRVWGDLSNYIIHINSEMHGAKRHFDKDGNHTMTHFHLSAIEINIPENLTDALFDHIELITYLILYTIEIIFYRKGTYHGIECFASHDKKYLIVGDSGHKSFKRLYEKIYNSH